MSAKFDGWAIVELMGRSTMAGRVTEEEHFGATLGRCDVPDGQGGYITTYFGGSSIYRFTPVSEEAAREYAHRNTPRAVRQLSFHRDEEDPDEEYDYGRYDRD